MAILNPEGVSSLSPGLLYSATLGKVDAPCPTPTGLWRSPRVGGHAADLLRPVCPLGAATPLGLGGASRSFPRVAEYSNPGLTDETPSGYRALLTEGGRNGQTPAPSVGGPQVSACSVLDKATPSLNPSSSRAIFVPTEYKRGCVALLAFDCFHWFHWKAD